MIFSEKVIDFTQQPYFFGEGRNLARTDLPLDNFIEKLADTQRGLMWFPTDFNYKEDTQGFLDMGKSLQELFLMNLKFQVLLDSVATRSAELFNVVTTNPVLEKWWVLHSYMESIHSDSYSELIKALPINSSEEFDKIMVDESILNRGRVIYEPLNEFDKLVAQYILDGKVTIALKKGLIKALYALNILENIAFQTSFIFTYAFAENGYMIESAKAMSKINLDENTHTVITIVLLNRLRKDPEYTKIFDMLQDEVKEMYKFAIESDFKWIDTLMAGKQLLGISADLLKDYAVYNFRRGVRDIHLDVDIDYKKVDTNPIGWLPKYIDRSKIQTALNETVSGNYLLGIVKPQKFTNLEKYL
jgi:ribonucleoside-diphosphate reductase beta chain